MMMSCYRKTSKLTMGMIQNHRYNPSNINRYSIADQNPTSRLVQSKQYCNHTSSSSNSPTSAGNNVNPTTITTSSSSSSSSSAFFAMTSALKYKCTSFIKCSYNGNPNRAAGSKKGWFGKLVKWFLISSGVSLAYVYHQNLETVPYTKRTRFIPFPTWMDQVLGEVLFKHNKESCEIVPENENECIRLRLILKNIIDALHREVTNKETDDGHIGAQATTKHLDELNWEILLVSNRADFPVYCFPGKIVVDTSVLQHFQKDDEIATLIAHEVGHVVARHTAEKFTKGLCHYFIVKLITQFPIVLLFSSSWVPMPYIVNKISYILQELPRYLQRHEMEADYIGLILMALAGYDPRIAPKVYKNLGCLNGNYKPSSYSLRTHPCGEGRAHLLSQVMDKPLAMYRKTKLDRVQQKKCVVT